MQGFKEFKGLRVFRVSWVVKVQMSLLSASSSDGDFLTRQVISGPGAETEGDEKLHNFLLALEGLWCKAGCWFGVQGGSELRAARLRDSC